MQYGKYNSVLGLNELEVRFMSPVRYAQAQLSKICLLQGDQLYMAVCFWYFVKRNLSTVQCTML